MYNFEFHTPQKTRDYKRGQETGAETRAINLVNLVLAIAGKTGEHKLRFLPASYMTK